MKMHLDNHQVALVIGVVLGSLNFLMNEFYGTHSSGEMTWYFWLIPPGFVLISYYLCVEWRRKRFRDRVGPLR